MKTQNESLWINALCKCSSMWRSEMIQVWWLLPLNLLSAGHYWDERTSPTHLCPQLPELLHQGHAPFQDSHPQHVRWHPAGWGCQQFDEVPDFQLELRLFVSVSEVNVSLVYFHSGGVQDCRHGTRQILPGAEDRRGGFLSARWGGIEKQQVSGTLSEVVRGCWSHYSRAFILLLLSGLKWAVQRRHVTKLHPLTAPLWWE